MSLQVSKGRGLQLQLHRDWGIVVYDDNMLVIGTTTTIFYTQITRTSPPGATLFCLSQETTEKFPPPPGLYDQATYYTHYIVGVIFEFYQGIGVSPSQSNDEEINIHIDLG